jgi:hypothetical protein
MADTGGKRVTDRFRFKHHAISVPEITATNRIINATTRLATAIAGIQDAPLNEAIQSLPTLLLGKVAPLPPPTPSILATSPPPTPLVDKDKPIIIWNPQLVQTNTPNQSLPKMFPTKLPQSSMVHGFRGWRLTQHNPSPGRRSNASMTSLVPSCTMHEQLIQHLLLHSVPLHHAKARAHGQWLMCVPNSSTTLLHILIQTFDTRHVTWYCWYTRTCVIPF